VIKIVTGDEVTKNGVYVITKGFTGTININAQNVKLTQENSSTALENVSIIGPSGGNANLWIENLNIRNTEDKSVIRFQGANNILSVKGTNYLSVRISSTGNTAFSAATTNSAGGL